MSTSFGTTDSGTTTDLARSRVPSYAVLIGVVYAICVVAMSISIVVEMQLGYVGSGDQPRSLGEQLAGVVGFGTGGLVLSLLATRWFGSEPGRARTGAVVMGALCVPGLAFFWCGMPGLLGATAAHLAGLTRGGTPASGAPRVFGLVGLVLAILNPVVHTVLLGGSWLAELL